MCKISFVGGGTDDDYRPLSNLFSLVGYSNLPPKKTDSLTAFCIFKAKLLEATMSNIGSYVLDLQEQDFDNVYYKPSRNSENEECLYETTGSTKHTASNEPEKIRSQQICGLSVF